MNIQVMQRSLILLTLALLTGCASSMVVEPGTASKSSFAPLNEVHRPGIVRYLNMGAPPVVRARREHAYRQMYERCHGEYRILSEGPRNQGGSGLYWGYGISTYQANEYIYIQFRCDAGEPEPTASPVSTSPQRTNTTTPLPDVETPKPVAIHAIANHTGLFQAPDHTSRRVGSVSTLVPLAVLQREGLWLYVETPSGARGWVHQAWVKGL